MIFICFLARSSRTTWPKIRVPIGSSFLVTSTAAFESKRITEPSGRRMSVAVRTLPALCTSPFLTRPRGAASLTLTTMMSPTPAVRRFEPPSTLMHWTRLAPLLSATSRLDCIWIIVRPYSLSILRSGVRVGDVFGLGLLRRLLGGLLCLFLGRLRGLGLGRGNDFRLGDLDGADLGGTNAVKDRPGLQLRDRGALFNAHDLAGAELVLPVVSVVLLRQLDDLAVQRVLHPPLDTDHDRLVTLVGHYSAGEDALWHLFCLLSPWPAPGRVRAAAS